MLLERWQARPRQNPLTRALQEYGRLQRTLFLLHYLAAPAYRREISRQLNRTESFHALRRRIFFGQHRHVRRPHDDHSVASAGLLLPAMLAARLGIEALANEIVDLGNRPGTANPGRKVMTLVHSMVVGGECINDADVLRSG